MKTSRSGNLVAAIRFFAGAISLAAIALCTAAQPAVAKEGESFICAIVPSGKFPDAFPEAVGVAVGSPEEGVFVQDPLINYYNGGPIKAEVKADNDARLSIKWSLKIKDEDTGQAFIRLHYEMMILKAELTTRIRLKATGDSLEFVAVGTCVRQKF